MSSSQNPGLIIAETSKTKWTAEASAVPSTPTEETTDPASETTTDVGQSVGQDQTDDQTEQTHEQTKIDIIDRCVQRSKDHEGDDKISTVASLVICLASIPPDDPNYRQARRLIDILDTDDLSGVEHMEEEVTSLFGGFMNTMPMTMLMPLAAVHLNFGVLNDIKCIRVLEMIRPKIEGKMDTGFIDELIAFLNSDDGVYSPINNMKLQLASVKLGPGSWLSNMAIAANDYIDGLIDNSSSNDDDGNDGNDSDDSSDHIQIIRSKG